MIFQKIFLFGIDNAGKTCLSEAMRTGKEPETLFPTTTFDIKSLFIKHFEDSIEFRVWDAPGQKSYRDVWGEGYRASNLITFVLDLTDDTRFHEAREVLFKVLDDKETKGVPLIFCFHKIDKKHARENLALAKDTFDLDGIMDRRVFPVETSINDPASIQKIKNTIADIVAKSRMPVA